MSDYKHGNWYCRPANKAEAREIVERAVARGAKNACRWRGNSINRPYGVIRGRLEFDTWQGTEYTIEQVREMFPLPGEREDTLPTIKSSTGRWVTDELITISGFEFRPFRSER